MNDGLVVRYPLTRAQWNMPCHACPVWILAGERVAWASANGMPVEPVHAHHCVAARTDAEATHNGSQGLAT
jgi:hypothetical protein